MWKSKFIGLSLPETPQSCEFVIKNFRYKALCRTELEFSEWFDSERNYFLHDSDDIIEDGDSSWPVYDLAISEDRKSIVTVSDCVRIFDVNKHKLKGSMSKKPK